jgi:hypothetical protein
VHVPATALPLYTGEHTGKRQQAGPEKENKETDQRSEGNLVPGKYGAVVTQPFFHRPAEYRQRIDKYKQESAKAHTAPATEASDTPADRTLSKAKYEKPVTTASARITSSSVHPYPL